MRVTENTRAQSIIHSLYDRSGAMVQLYGKMASMQEVQRPSDDPARCGMIMRMTSHIAGLEKSLNAIQSAQSFTTAVSSSMEACEGKLTRIKTLAIKAANSAMSEADRRAIGDEVNQLFESLVEFGNQTFEDRYIFGGTQTQRAPLLVERDAEGRISGVTYQGSDDQLQVPIAPGRTITVSPLGSDLYLDSGLLDAVQSLRDHLWNTSGVTYEDQSAALQTDLDAVATARDELAAEVGRFGAHASELDMQEELAEAGIVRAKDALSTLQDADLAQLTVDMKKEETIYQALLSAGAQIMRVSLMDYL